MEKPSPLLPATGKQFTLVNIIPYAFQRSLDSLSAQAEEQRTGGAEIDHGWAAGLLTEVTSDE